MKAIEAKKLANSLKMINPTDYMIERIIHCAKLGHFELGLNISSNWAHRVIADLTKLGYHVEHSPITNVIWISWR